MWPCNDVTGAITVPQTFLLHRHASAHPAVRRYLLEVCRRMPPRKSSGKCLTSVGRSLPSARARRTSAISVSVRSLWWTRLFTCQVSIFFGKCSESRLLLASCSHLVLFVLVWFHYLSLYTTVSLSLPQGIGCGSAPALIRKTLGRST